MFFLKVGVLVYHTSQNFFFGMIRPIFNAGNDFENQNFDIFEEVVHNFGKSYDDII